MNRIKETRIRLNMGQKEIAIALGVAQPTVSAWESGRKDPTVENLSALAELFDVSTDFLLGRTNDPRDYEDGDLIASISPHLLEAHGGNVKKALAAQIEIEAEAHENSSYMQTYSFRIRDLRQERGLSERELAEKAEIHESRLAGIENGAYKISLEELERVCRALRVSLAEMGADTQSIQKLAGHTDYGFTANQYTHPEVETLRKAINKM